MPIDIIGPVRNYYLQVISGRRRGIAAACVRTSLSGLSMLYGLGVRLRNWGYAAGLRRPARVSIPVISIGNLTAGGTGKTPMVEWLARRLVRQNLTVAVLARGYGPPGKLSADDEPLPPELVDEGVARHIGADRVAWARALERTERPDVILLDDGFQHRRLHRDLDILMIDAVEPFSNRHLLPRGLLREPLRGAGRAGHIVLSRADQVDPVELERLVERIQAMAPGVPIAQARHRPTEVRNLWNGRAHAPEWLKDRPVYAFCGIGNPVAFRRSLEALKANVVRFRTYPDHHAYTPRDLRQVDAEGQEFLAEAILTTEKDAVKLDSDTFSLTPLALKVEMELTEGSSALIDAVRRQLPQTTQIGQF